MDIPKLCNCSPNDVLKMFKKLGGFEIIKDGAKHYGVKHIKTQKKTTVPRSNPVDRYILKNGIIKHFLIEGLDYKEKDIYRYIHC